MKTKPAILPILLALLLAACSTAQPTTPAPADTPAPSLTPLPSATATLTLTPSITPTSTITATPTITPTATPDVRPTPRYWAAWPVVPHASFTALAIHQRGLQMGNNPAAYSTIGDCQSEPNVFLGIYATDRYYLAPDYQYLQETIGFFYDSFSHKSLAVVDGLSAPSALSPLWADPSVCLPDENPVQCELRLYKPSIVFINLGTNWQAGASAQVYEGYLRQIVDLVIAAGAVPVLSTKADNVEGDHSLNLATATVAYDYDIPLWNFWLAADSLPNHGLDADRGNIYLTPDGWDVRNFTALVTLDQLRKDFAAAQ